MTAIARGRTEATPRTTYDRSPTRTASRVKALIVRLALCGLLPVGLAIWVIRRGGLRDA